MDTSLSSTVLEPGSTERTPAAARPAARKPWLPRYRRRILAIPPPRTPSLTRKHRPGNRNRSLLACYRILAKAISLASSVKKQCFYSYLNNVFLPKVVTYV